MNLEKCAPSGITCEGIENPIGITVRSPRFSWIFNQNGNNRYQKAYRIVVAKDSESGEIVWDSGKVTSGETRFILYQGKPLQSGTRYWFTIQLWDREDREGIKSSPSYFETALFNDALWKAEWIAGDSLLRKEFSISSDKTEARLYASGLGYRKIWINGFPVGDDELAPSYTDYEEMTEYRLYRVENLLQSGKNTVAIMLGNSFYSGIQCAILQLEIKDGKGTINRIISDNTWRCAPGPIIENSIYDGEVFDARKEPEGWRFPGFDDSLWKKVQTVPSPAKRLVSALLPPIQITDTLSPIRITRLDRNTQAADFGKNIAGWAVLAMNAASGDKVTLR
jgi:alpha-L-rhamnosidase